jgi:protein-tyrosine phosphatase
VKREKTVLFLCTGNYYRSRFAEELFNHRVVDAGVTFAAQSRGLAVERGTFNVGPLSPFARQGLGERGVTLLGGDRLPQQCSLVDLEAAHHVVALDETEHRPLMRERFPYWENGVEYWQVADVELTSPKLALAEIEQQVDALLTKLFAG